MSQGAPSELLLGLTLFDYPLSAAFVIILCELIKF
jgi:hypothetical protein